MKELHVKKVITDSNLLPEQIPALFAKEQVTYQFVDIVNWKEYPYLPEMKFAIAHTGDWILLHYHISEQSVRAVAPADNGRVWEDSCAEFFIQPNENEKVYYNFECNCAGTLLIEFGLVGNRTYAPSDILENVKRWASLGRVPFDEKAGQCTWDLTLIIPISAFFHHSIQNLDGTVARANFYKCGDLLQTPHFLSWNPINLPKPCFHCPDFFGKIYFDK